MNAMLKLFSIRGGIHPEGRKQRTASLPIEKAPLPPMLYLPMRQHVGVPSEPVVTAGDHVKAGQLVGICSKDISAMMHAPTSGEVVDIGPHVAPHPSGLPGLTLSIRPDGKEECVPLLPPLDPFLSEAESIAERIAAAGIVGMGGAVFPAAEKLELRSIYDLHTLVINGAECEPYLTTDDRLMRERAEAIIDGARIIRHTLGVKTIIIAIEANKPEALAAMTAAARDFLNLEIRPVAVRYPMGSEKHLVQALTGLETPAGQLPVALGVLVHNVATAHAVHEVVRFGKPLTSRIITVSGGAIRHPANLEVLIGTPIRHLVEICGGFTGEPERIIMGGPMMGTPITDLDAPVVKGTNAILALTGDEVRARRRLPCIRCGACVTACPCGLEPLDMMARIAREKIAAAVDIGLRDCIACGACSYVCPSHIPLVHYFNYAKGALLDQQRVKAVQMELKQLAEARTARLAAQARAKAEARARRQAQLAAKKAAAKKRTESSEAGA